MTHPAPEDGYSEFRRKYPRAWYWVKRGLQPKAARVLVEAGFFNVEDLAGRKREELTALSGLGELSLARLEELLGSPIPSRRGELVERGIPKRIADALGRQGIDSLEKLGRLTREQYLAMNGLSEKNLRVCEAALGRALDSPVREWRQLGLPALAAHRLSQLGFRTLQELAGVSAEDLRKRGLTEQDAERCQHLLWRHRRSQR